MPHNNIGFNIAGKVIQSFEFTQTFRRKFINLDKFTVKQGGIVKTNGHKLNYQTAAIKGKNL